jgi:hypothetical protein
MSYEHITQSNVPCPVCGELTCNFVPAKLNRQAIAAWWFDQMRKQVDAATTPELPTMVNYKKLL